MSNYYRHLIQANAPAPVNPLFANAVAYYKLDETSGNAIDVVNGYNGNINGNVSQGVTGKIGNAYEFFTNADSVSIPDNSYFSFADANGDIPFTIRCWVNFKSFPTTPLLGVWLISKRLGGFTNREWQLTWYYGDLRIQVFESNDSQGGENLNASFINSNLNINQWYHIVATYDGSKTKEGLSIYLDGIDKTNSRTGDNALYTGMSPTVSPVTLGNEGGWSSSDLSLSGSMDEVCIIKNEAWKPAQVAEDYNNGLGTTI